MTHEKNREKSKDTCLASWHDWRSKCSCFTRPDLPLETKERKRLKKHDPKWKCQTLKQVR